MSVKRLVLYVCFTRAWWKGTPAKRVPNLHARKRTLAIVDTEEEAQSICRQWNESHKPDWRSVKAEYDRYRYTR